MENPVTLLKLFDSNKLPIILQTEAAECGLASLAMIASYYGHKIDLNTLRQRYPISLKGIGLHGLMKIADQFHFATRALRLEIEEIKNLSCPVILHWDLNHFIVLKKVKNRSVVIHDPAKGERVLSFDEVSKHFTGIGLELIPTQEFKPKDEERKVHLSDLFQRITGLKRILIQVLMLSLLLQVFTITAPFFMQLVIDEVVVSQDVELLAILALGFFLMMLIRVGVTALRSLVVINMGAQLSIQLANNLFRHLIRLPLSYFEKRHIGDIMSRFGSMDAIKDMLSNEIITAVVDGIMLFGTLAMMFIYSPTLALVVVISVSIYGVFRFSVYRRFYRLTEEGIVAGAKEDSNFMETIRAAQSVKLFGNESQRQSLWQNLYADSLNTGIRIKKLEVNYATVNGVLFGVENITVIYWAAQLVINMQLTVGMIFAFMAYKKQFTDKAASLIGQAIKLKMMSLHLARLGDIVMTEIEQDPHSGFDSRVVKGGVKLENVSFRYSETEPYIIDNAHLDIKAGESICLVGPSGCGKSTLMKVMLGLMDPTGGKILVDGIDIKVFGLRSYRQQIASVMQNDQLLSGSLSDNISFFDPNFDQKKIEEYAKLAAIHDEIMKMPMGYNSLIGDMGTTLSGGQKQRVLLARALYKEPKILFLDESTAHLDISLEQEINNNISQMNLTRIVIAHRPETIDFADRVILVTPEGCIDQDSKFKQETNAKPEMSSQNEMMSPVGNAIIPDF